MVTNLIFTTANYLVQINNIHNFLNIQQHIAKHNCVIVEFKTFLGPQNLLCCFCLHTQWTMRTDSLICKHQISLFPIYLSTYTNWLSIQKLLMQLFSFFFTIIRINTQFNVSVYPRATINDKKFSVVCLSSTL